jgi:hypothetical protein
LNWHNLEGNVREEYVKKIRKRKIRFLVLPLFSSRTFITSAAIFTTLNPSIHLRIQTPGPAIVYKTDIDAHSSGRKLMAFALPPPNQIKLGFDDIVEEASDSIADLID